MPRSVGDGDLARKDIDDALPTYCRLKRRTAQATNGWAVSLVFRRAMLGAVDGGANDPAHTSTRECFEELRNSSTRSWQTRGLRISVRSVGGALSRAVGRVILSADAIRWYQKGGGLKQFEEATVSFEIESEEPIDRR